MTNHEELKIARAKVVKTWEELGLLKGLKGHLPPHIAALYECKPSFIIPKDK